MCGIAGLITDNLSSEIKASKVRRMVDLLVHRGPDDEGIWTSGQACFGHRRLSIIDLSSGGHQPMVDGNHVLVYNGEIYNYQNLRQELEARGIRFQSHSDTEVLLRGYRVWGEEVVSKIRGMFAFALWDTHQQRLFCARDPFGKKPFYYFWDKRQFVFASEIEAVVAGLDARPDIDYTGLSYYLLKGYFAPGKTVYSSVFTLEAGQSMEVCMMSSRLQKRTIRQPRFSLDEPERVPYEALKEKYNDLIGTAVDRRFESDVPVGVTLSGGVDSSLISLIAAERQPRHQTFTVSFRNSPFDETRYAAQVATRADTEHIVVDGTIDSMPEMLSLLVEVYGEPYGDYSAIPAYCLFKAIKPYIKVGLMGDGGDEVFAGYTDVKVYLFRMMLSKFLGVGDFVPKSLRRRMIYSRRRKLRELGYALWSLQSDGAEVFQALRRGGWTNYWRKKMMRPDAWRFTGEGEVEQEECRLFMTLGRTDLERYLNLNLERLTQDFLVKIDRASMAHSIEARSPFLDVDLFEQVKGLTKTLILRKGEPKSILKDLLDERMGRGFARRRKMGFTPPLIEWLRAEDTLSWLERRLTDKCSFSRSLFTPDAIRKMLTQHRVGWDHTGRLWNLLFLNEWHARFYGSGKSLSQGEIHS